jgi:hypothetical protein
MASGDSEVWDRRFQLNQRPFRLLSLFAGTASVAAVVLLTQLSS